MEDYKLHRQYRFEYISVLTNTSGFPSQLTTMMKVAWLIGDSHDNFIIVEPQPVEDCRTTKVGVLLDNTMIVEQRSFGNNHDGSSMGFLEIIMIVVPCSFGDGNNLMVVLRFFWR